MIRAQHGILALALSLGAVLVAFQAPAHAQTGRNVLVVVNAANRDSVRIGEHYANRRGFPPEQVIRLTALPSDPPDGIDRTVFERAIQSPVATWLGRHQAQDRILFIVLTKGVPLRINAPAGENSAASVDSELALLYLRLTGATVELDGPLPNPLFLGDKPVTGATPFTRATSSLYLVTRLDGYSVDDVLGLIDRAMAPSKTGRFVLDGKSTWTERAAGNGNGWLRTAAERLSAAGLPPDRIVADQSATVLADLDDVLGYYSWGSNDPAIRRRDFNLKFRNGAIGGMFVSTDGRTFREPPAGWMLPGWDNKAAWHAGTPQSLAGDLIREGITGVSGHVAEPLLGNTIRPDILFPAYVAGFTLAEAYYLAMPSVSWMTVVVGDPLCAPFADGARSIEDPPIDLETELPASFSARRLAVLGNPDIPLEVRQALLRAESRLRREDVDGARADLERATRAVPKLLVAQFMLAGLYERANDTDAAIGRYRAILEVAPESATAMNNLAYLLAVKKGDLVEAQPLAERALKLSPTSGEIADTYGWILHIAGEGRRALQMLTQAARLAPRNAEIHLHVARVAAALGDKEKASASLATALQLDPALAERAEVKALQAQ